MFSFTPPPSKSYTNRALVLATLVNGISTINNYAKCEDTLYMTRAFKKYGAHIKEHKDKLIVYGNGGVFNKNKIKLYCGNAGTTFRFLTALSILNKGVTIITGSKRMQERPIGELVEALRQLSVQIQSNNDYPPVIIHGGNFQSKKITISSKISSQHLSALLLIMPILGKDFIIEINDDIPSIPYIKMTLETLKKFGVKVNHQNYRKFYLLKNLQLKPAEIIIESDASSATYFFGSAAVLKKRIKVYGLKKNSNQADIKFIRVLQKMGCSIDWDNNSVKLQGNNLKGISIDMNDAPDSVPTLAVVSLFAKGKTKITNIENLRYKESNRIEALANELTKLGAIVKTGEDCIEITPAQSYKSAIIETYNDHRIAMAFAIAKLRIPGLKIKNPNCVKKSFPNFWSEFNKMRVSYKV